MPISGSFSGAKLALFLGKDLLVIKRDLNPEIPWPGHWDLPGGGRENHETPEQCALRETVEEVGLRLTPKDLVWARTYQRPHGRVWFFVAHQPADRVQDVVFGNEGQGWKLMPPSDYLADPLAIGHFAAQLRLYLEETQKSVP